MTIKKMFETFQNPMVVMTSLILKSPVDIKLRNGLIFKGCVGEHASILNEVFGDECYTRFRKIKKGDIVVDAGASIGDITLLALISGAKVFPFEMSLKIQKMLKRNLIVNGFPNVKIYGKFDKDSLKSFKRIDFLKIDIEGGEFDSLLGMKDSDLKKAKYVVMEVHYNCGNVDGVIFKLKRCGFKVVHLHHKRCPKWLGYIYARNTKFAD